jgi:hypothetical protein
VWRVVQPSRFDHVQWGDDIVLYVVDTGETHALTAAHGAVFLTLLEQSGTAQPAADWLACMSGDSPPNSASAGQEPGDLRRVEDVLTSLERMGLVERLPG